MGGGDGYGSGGGAECKAGSGRLTRSDILGGDPKMEKTSLSFTSLLFKNEEIRVVSYPSLLASIAG